MKKVNKQAFSLIELMAVMPIVIIVSYYMVITVQRIFTRLKVHSSLSSVRIDMISSLSRQKVEFENVMMLSRYDKDGATESFNKIGEDDYYGIYGVVSSDRYSECRYSDKKDSNGYGPYSIIRYTYISRLKRFLTLFESWKDVDFDGDGEIDPILLYYKDIKSNPSDETRKLTEVVRPYIFEGLENENKKNIVNELLVINKELWTKGRYLVKDVKFLEEDLTNKLPKRLELILKRPALSSISGVDHPSLKVNFIKNSYVYPVVTKVLCVNTDGALASYEEISGKKQIIFNPLPHDLFFKKFEISYGGLNSGNEIELSSFKNVFPLINERRRCIDLIKFNFDLAPKIKNVKDKGIVESHVFHLPNLSIYKNGDCDKIIKDWLDE